MSETASMAIVEERLTWCEICARFPDRWVVIVDAEWLDDHNFAFGTARVFSQHAQRRESTDALGAACRSFSNVGCFFTGLIRARAPRLLAS